jgi:hypothetical protein
MEIKMSDLLETAVAAHGGWERWLELKKLTARVSVDGGLLKAKGKTGAIADAHFTLDPHRQHGAIALWRARTA